MEVFASTTKKPAKQITVQGLSANKEPLNGHSERLCREQRKTRSWRLTRRITHRMACQFSYTRRRLSWRLTRLITRQIAGLFSYTRRRLSRRLVCRITHRITRRIARLFSYTRRRLSLRFARRITRRITRRIAGHSFCSPALNHQQIGISSLAVLVACNFCARAE